jgi:ribosomal protein S18 acetylase RimI-like enzyme
MIELVCATSDEEMETVRCLFREYAESLDFDLDFQDFEDELEGIPGAYGPPAGRLRMALLDGEAVGCIAIRRIDSDVCEMKRLYVRPDSRRRGIGRLLAETGVRDALELGYRAIRLDTVPSMIAATALYRAIGFTEIEPYRHNPIAGALFMELRLPDPP